MQESTHAESAAGQTYLQATVDTVKSAASFVADSVKQVVGAAPGDDDVTAELRTQPDASHETRVGTGSVATLENTAPANDRQALLSMDTARGAVAAVVRKAKRVVGAGEPSLAGCAVAEGADNQADTVPEVNTPASPKPTAPTGPSKAKQEGDSTAEDGEWKVKKPETSQPQEPEQPQGFFERVKEDILATQEKVQEDAKWAVGAQQDNRLGEFVQPTADNIKQAITTAAEDAILGPKDHRNDGETALPAPKKEEKSFLEKWFGWCWCCGSAQTSAAES